MTPGIWAHTCPERCWCQARTIRNGVAYRLTRQDETRIADALTASLDPVAAVYVTDPERLRRIAAHSIGLALVDMRDVEVEWIDAAVVAACTIARELANGYVRP